MEQTVTKIFIEFKLNIPVPVQLFIIYPHPTKNILNPYYKSQYFKNPGHKNKKGTEEQISLKSSVLYGEGGVKNSNRCAKGLWKHRKNLAVILTLKRKTLYRRWHLPK